jgi:FKBP-type peptidyl-prolyl cis-trans isomerase
MNKFTKLSLCLCLLATVLFSACEKEYDSIETIDDTAIQAFVKASSIKYTKDTKGYYYSVTNQGAGPVVKNSDSVFYSYKFKTLNGQLLNQSSDFFIPGTFLGYTDQFTISGTNYLFTPIREVLSKLNRGGTATVILPSNLAFGKNGLSAINVGSNENILVELSIYTQTKIHDINELELNNFLKANNLTAIKDASRVRYIVTQQGTGAQVLASSTVSVNYTGRLLTGTIFNPATTAPVPFTLAETIKGWDILKNFRVGTKLRLFVPSDLGYGQEGRRDLSTGVFIIPPNAGLDFDIEIVSVAN